MGHVVLKGKSLLVFYAPEWVSLEGIGPTDLSCCVCKFSTSNITSKRYEDQFWSKNGLKVRKKGKSFPLSSLFGLVWLRFLSLCLFSDALSDFELVDSFRNRRNYKR